MGLVECLLCFESFFTVLSLDDWWLLAHQVNHDQVNAQSFPIRNRKSTVYEVWKKDRYANVRTKGCVRIVQRIRYCGTTITLCSCQQMLQTNQSIWLVPRQTKDTAIWAFQLPKFRSASSLAKFARFQAQLKNRDTKAKLLSCSTNNIVVACMPHLTCSFSYIRSYAIVSTFLPVSFLLTPAPYCCRRHQIKLLPTLSNHIHMKSWLYLLEYYK